jgi:ATP-dependent Clp endopeptidase proteolytic subunit ClpP
MSEHWLRIQDSGKKDEPAEILIYDQIGTDWYENSGMGAKQFAAALKTIPPGRQITVGINSPGGNVWDGLAIYNQLQARKQDVTCRIDGVACSIASIIAMAGSKTVMPKNALLMIHDPSGFCVGSEDDMRKMADELAKTKESLAGIYSDKTKRPRAEIDKAMSDETWFTGAEAKVFGLVDEITEDQAAQNSFSLSRYRRVPAALGTVTAPAAVTADTKGTSMPDTTTVPAGAAQTPPQDKATTPPPTVATPPASPPIDLAAEVARINAQLAQERERRIRNELGLIVAANRIPANAVDTWLPLALKDESVLQNLNQLPEMAPPGAPPSRIGSNKVGAENVMDRVLAIEDPHKRHAFLTSEWGDLWNQVQGPRMWNTMDAQGRIQMAPKAPQATNTLSATLITQFLVDALIVNLQHRLAPLKAFTREFSPDPIKPKTTVQVPNATAAGTTQSNATSFEDTTNFVVTLDPISVTMAQYTAGGHLTTDQMQKGFRIAQMTEIKLREFANKIVTVATTPCTVANFTTGSPGIIASYAGFSFTDMNKGYGLLKKAGIKNAILDGEYIANLLPTYQLGWNPITDATKFGWDGIYLNTDWDGAGANVRGFLCHPQAVVVVAGTPLELPATTSIVQVTQVRIPDLEMTVLNYLWFNPSTRTTWFTYDVVMGASAGDTTAGVCLKIA